MQSILASVLALTLALPSLVFGADAAALAPAALVGYSPRGSATEREWETKLRGIPDPANLREYMTAMLERWLRANDH